jgi:hypothetical protein
MKRATAYLRRGRIFLEAKSKTMHGVWIQSDPISAVDPDKPDEIGRAVLVVLACSKQGVSQPSRWQYKLNPIYSLAGVSSWDTFATAARCVGIALEGDTITFVPYRNLGGKEGFVRITGKGRSCLPDSAKIGATLMLAFDDVE